MTEEHDHDLTTDLPDDQLDQIEELRAQAPIETAKSVAAEDVPTGALPLAGGGILLVSALRSVLRGQLRAIPKAIAGAGLVRFGLGRRRSASSESPTFDPSTDVEDVEGGTEGKETADEAHAAVDESEGSPGDRGRDSQLDDAETGSRVEFTEDEDDATAEPRSKPDAEMGEADPRRNTDADADDESVEIDVSDSAMADEASEATGPDPEQAQPSQTDSIEPEETPEEDASHMKVEPDEDDEGDEDAADDESADNDEDEDEFEF